MWIIKYTSAVLAIATAKRCILACMMLSTVEFLNSSATSATFTGVPVYFWELVIKLVTLYTESQYVYGVH